MLKTIFFEISVVVKTVLGQIYTFY